MLRELLPNLKRVAYLSNPEISGSLLDATELRAAIKRIGIDILWLDARNGEEIERAFVEMNRKKVGGAIFATEDTFAKQIPRLSDLARKNRLPAVMGFAFAADAGLLASYGVDSASNYIRAAEYVDKILKGAKPGDLAISQPTKFELVLNRKTAKLLGITIPKTVLFRADRVIE